MDADIVPDIEDFEISSFDLNVDFEPGKDKVSSQKNFTGTRKSEFSKITDNDEEGFITGGNITLEFNEEIEICNQVFSWGEEIVEIATEKSIQEHENLLEFEGVSKIMNYGVKDDSEVVVSSKQILSWGGDLVKISADKGVCEVNNDTVKLETSGEKTKCDNRDKLKVNDSSKRIFSWGEDLIEFQSGKRIRENESDPVKVEETNKCVQYTIEKNLEENEDNSQMFSHGVCPSEVSGGKRIREHDPLYTESSNKIIKYDKVFKSDIDSSFCIQEDNKKDVERTKWNYDTTSQESDNPIAIDNMKGESLCVKSSTPNSTPEKNEFSVANSSPKSDFSLPDRDTVSSIPGSVTASVQESEYDIDVNVEDTEEPESEPDLILYSPRTSSDTEQDRDIGYRASFMNNYIFDLFGAED